MKTIKRIFSYYGRYPKLASAQLLCAILMTAMLPIFSDMSGRIFKNIINEHKKSEKTTEIVNTIQNTTVNDQKTKETIVKEISKELPDLQSKEYKEDNSSNLLFYTLIALASFFGRDFFNCLRILINNVFEQKAIYDLRSELYTKLQRLPLNWFDTRRTGDVMTRVAEDVPSMERLLIDGVEQGLVAVIQIIGVAAFLIYQDTILGLTALAPIPLLAIGAYIYTKNARDRHRDVKKYTGDMNSLLSDNISGIRQIKSYAAEHEEKKRFNLLSNKVRQATLKVMKYWAFYSPSMSFVNSLGYVLVLGVGGYRIINDPTVGTEIYLIFFTIIWALYEPIGRLHGLNQMALSSKAAADRVFEILDTPDEIHADDGDTLTTPVRGEVSFSNMSFTYKDEKPSKKNTPADDLPEGCGVQTPTDDSDGVQAPADDREGFGVQAPADDREGVQAHKATTLKNITFTARPGETVALVGTTGAGKSTLVNLLTRFYEYDTGSITIDGKELNTINKTSLRNSIAYVTQDAFLFNGTVRENMILGKRDATDDELWIALKAANADTYVKALPRQLDTNVGERGVKLSGGEKQRLSIARALLKNQPILILDEATASVDSKTEKLIQDALDNLMSTRTAFVIAHRLSTIQNADCIYVLDHGEIIEKGTHTELLNLNGKYASLSKQSFLEQHE